MFWILWSILQLFTFFVCISFMLIISIIWLIFLTTWVENPREGVAKVFAKIPRGGEVVKDFRKSCKWGPPILTLIAFLLTSVLKFAWSLVLYLPSQAQHPHPPVCIFVNNITHLNDLTYINNFILQLILLI